MYYSEEIKMREGEIREKLEELIIDLSSLIKKRLGKSSEGLTLIGSCATGRMSLSRPDIGIFLFLKKGVGGEAFLKLGEVFTALIKKYEGTFALRPEFRPFKFSYPLNKKDLQVFLSGSIGKMEEKDDEFPFGVPKDTIAGMKRAKKVVWGKDILAQMDTKIDKQYILKAGLRDVSMYRLQLSFAPMIYRLDIDYGLFLDEALSLGKQAARRGIGIAATEAEIKTEKFLDFFEELEGMISFYKQRYDSKTSKAVETILEAREKYDVWKKRKEKAYLVYKAASQVTEAVWVKLISQIS